MAHETRTHAVLSASASKRWLSCPPSAKLNTGDADGVYVMRNGMQIAYSELVKEVEKPNE